MSLFVPGSGDLSRPIRRALELAVEAVLPVRDGAVADYIPELAKADPEHLGVALVSGRGTVHEVGDTEVPFTIQSVSKPFVYALALQTHGLAKVCEHVGLEPTGEPFNAISLESDTGRPGNPMINAGAIVTTSLIPGDTAAEKSAVIAAGLAAFAGRELEVDEAVFGSEFDTGDRNRALGYLTQSAGTLVGTTPVATEAYFRQCAQVVTARDIAVMAATLACGGVNPLTRERVVSEDVARWTTAVMASCGMYDASGAWMVDVGLPAKSGVGGGVVALMPGQFGIGTFSPPLDRIGNSARGVALLRELSHRYELHTLAYRGSPLSPIAALDFEDDTTVVTLRGDLIFQGAEEVLSRLAPLARDADSLTLDFSSVTRMAPAARQLFHAAVRQAGELGTTVAVRDPEGLLD